jgi:septal ring factor EnvC (AmiA/AmiB activator)
MNPANSFEKYSDNNLDLGPNPETFEKAVTRSDTVKKALHQENIITRSETCNILFNKVSEQHQKIKILEQNLVAITKERERLEKATINERERLEEQVRIAQLALNNKNHQIEDLKKDVENLTESVLYRKKHLFTILLIIMFFHQILDVSLRITGGFQNKTLAPK